MAAGEQPAAPCAAPVLSLARRGRTPSACRPRERSRTVSQSESAAGLVVERAGPILTLRIDRPAKRNALDAALLEALRATLDATASDTAVRAVIVTGGDKVFAAGVDIASFAAAPGVAN